MQKHTELATSGRYSWKNTENSINYFKNRLTEDLSSNDDGPENFWNGGP